MILNKILATLLYHGFNMNLKPQAIIEFTNNKKTGAVTVNLLPAIVGAGLVLLLLLPLFFLVVDPDLGTTSGLSTSGRPFLCLAPI